jgi:hypothetical protein
MDRTTPLGTKHDGGSTTSTSGANLSGAARAAHEAADNIAGKATAQVDRLSDSAHRAVDSAADVATSAAGWASNVADQAGAIQAKAMDSASAAIRQKPIAIVAGALVIGYLLGRL